MNDFKPHYTEFPHAGESKKRFLSRAFGLGSMGYSIKPNVFQALVRIKVINQAQCNILEFLFNRTKFLTAKSIRRETGMDHRSIVKNLNNLKQMNLIKDYKDNNPSVGTQWIINDIEVFEHLYKEENILFVAAQKKKASVNNTQNLKK